MNNLPWNWLFGLSAAATWFAVYSENKTLERASKPATLLILLIWTLSVRPELTLLSGAPLFSLLGDVALLEPQKNFIKGLSCFLIAHLFYIPIMMKNGSEVLYATLGLLIVTSPLVFKILKSISKKELKGAVAAYMLVLAIMVACAVTTGNPAIALGGLLFMISDSLLGWDRFVQHQKGFRLLNMITYHLGQYLIVSGFLL